MRFLFGFQAIAFSCKKILLLNFHENGAVQGSLLDIRRALNILLDPGNDSMDLRVTTDPEPSNDVIPTLIDKSAQLAAPAKATAAAPSNPPPKRVVAKATSSRAQAKKRPQTVVERPQINRMDMDDLICAGCLRSSFSTAKWYVCHECHYFVCQDCIGETTLVSEHAADWHGGARNSKRQCPRPTLDEEDPQTI